MNDKKIVIVGDGAIGLFLSVLLSQQHSVTLVGKHCDDRSRALRVIGHRSITGGQITEVHVASPAALDACMHASVVFICVKARDFASLANIFSRLPDTVPVVFVQNGLGIVERAKAHGLQTSENAVRMLCRFGVLLEDFESVRLAGECAVTIAPKNLAAGDVAQLLIETGVFSVDKAQSVSQAEWQKAFINVFVNPLCALVNRSNQAILEDPGLQSLAFLLVQEAVHVARAEGEAFSDFSREGLCQKVLPFKDNVNSHLMDLRRGRDSDMDALLGEIERRAARCGVLVPVTHTVYALFTAFSKQRKWCLHPDESS